MALTLSQKDEILAYFKMNALRGTIAEFDIRADLLPQMGIDPYGDDYKLFLRECEHLDIIYRQSNLHSYMLTRFGEFEFPGFDIAAKDKAEQTEIYKIEQENVRLTNDNLKYEETIRGLKEQLLILNLAKEYWWFIGICVVIGGVLTKLIFP